MTQTLGAALRRPGPRSLRRRLLVATVAGVAVALLLAGLALNGMFERHVHKQFEQALTYQLDQVMARFELDARGQPVLVEQALSDPRWNKPYSGLYWQVDAMDTDGQGRTGVLRSRSLWDTTLALQADALDDGAVHVHHVAGPLGAQLLVLERRVTTAGESARWRIAVAADETAMQAAMVQFSRALAGSLAVLLVLLAAAAWAQVAVGLRPLKVLETALQDVEQGRAPQLLGTFPAELQPVADGFNKVLTRNTQVVERARAQAANLAHALKTPLTVLEQAARAAASPAGEAPHALAPLVQEQVQVARRHIDWHLARARMAGGTPLPGQRAELGPAVQGLVRVMDKVHAGRGLVLRVNLPDQPIFFAGEEQDLQEMVGNLLDNACKWAQSAVRVGVQTEPVDPAAPKLRVEIEDDGPGIDASQRASALQRGVRLDESVAGSGLGLAIVQELAGLYGGHLELTPTPRGGLCAALVLPRAAPGVA
ncbi:sensor histidine kinase [Acidovorax sp. RAC01]|mgnify:CR=1 FL=1|uniref:sensor histidine kinase n=1 Tax=Acidovorax sp. RAC01 TaxID=1842533 RepID=UPI00083E954B|nr:HAMP domain-containing sensor histidine kinase [Acidovorax sp. RAC01]AOG23350.1 histidine kinase-, DNA gyrase B-, and HSP90-like ATPase family protein [Acidovorax sp. RAC01]